MDLPHAILLHSPSPQEGAGVPTESAVGGGNEVTIPPPNGTGKDDCDITDYPLPPSFRMRDLSRFQSRFFWLSRLS